VERPVVELDAAAAKALIDSTPALVVVDVSLQWKEGHIPGAKSYPMSGGWLEIGLPGLDPQRPHLVYARTDEASLAGAQLLASRGFHPVYRLRGNLAAWQDAGHPVALPRPAVLAVDAEEAQIIISTTPPLEAIDVSTQWTAGHIPGARSYPLADGSLARALRTLDKRRPYLVYGREPGPSFEAAQLLVDQGFGPVYWLEGGFQSWVDAGYAVGLPDATVTALSPTRAKQLIDATPELVIVDVSTAWAAGHLPGALSYPLAGGALDAALPGLDRSRPHLIYGREGDDALVGASRIAFAGFRFVYLLDGGFAAWVAAGLPIEP
jgi:rhodanese-related sulfurtransferase